MTDLVEVDDSDELPTSGFYDSYYIDGEPRKSITAILSFDKTKILEIQKITFKAGSESSTQAPKLLQKLDNQQVCLTCAVKMKMV